MAPEILRPIFEKSNSNPIMKLNEHGHVNVFCFPPAIGHGMAYIELAKLLENHCVTYGIDFIDEYTNDEDLMEQYVKIVTDVQDKQPYVFLGYSLGGNLAFEVAKAMELKGYVVSDIIMLDSIKRNGASEFSEDEAVKQVDALLEDMPEQYKHFVTPTFTHKIYSYAKYRDQLVNTGSVQANIHELIAKDSTKLNSEEGNCLSWRQATRSNYSEHQAKGIHEEMLDPEMIEENAKLVRHIVQKIIDETYAVSSHSTDRLR
ncbi:thioesterase domain-containing protein [Brevibacillus laterosporus]|uniref:thioesterase domain-containing protein n=1 Tax=Brevibacillus laterosporus TaxID=1465 RepID=UPI003B98721A